FFLQLDRHHLILQSFPTRRSSDLNSLSRVHFTEMIYERENIILGLARNPLIRLSLSGLYHILDLEEESLSRSSLESLGPALLSRSEEHTSELQSLAYLVCRLLLEK